MKHKVFQSLARIIAVLSLIIIIAVPIWAFNYFYYPKVDFTYYEPSYLPEGTKITLKRARVYSGFSKIELNFRTEDWVYSVSEYRADSNTNGPIGSADQNYDPTSLNPTCSIYTTEKGNTYRLCHWIDYGKISVYEVGFSRNGTVIYSLIPHGINSTIPKDQINRYVDSFKPKSTIGIPIKFRAPTNG